MKTKENIEKKMLLVKRSCHNLLLNSAHFKENYKIISLDLTQKQVLDADPRAIQLINSAGHLDHARSSKRNYFGLFSNSCKSVVSKLKHNNKFGLVLINWYYKMTQYNNLNVTLSNSQLKKIKSAIRNETEVF